MGPGATACQAGKDEADPRERGRILVQQGMPGVGWQEAFSEGFSVTAVLDNQLVCFIWVNKGSTWESGKGFPGE